MVWDTNNFRSLQNKFVELANQLRGALVDRDEEVSCLLAALVAGEHFLMVGPPGTAKSAICNALCDAIDGAQSFERLLGKFSEPAELFGPISLAGLKEDRFEHVVDGFLPTCEIGFVDEIGKASPAIINSLLTAMNERKFDNGRDRIDIPLRIMVSASNEWPVGEGYETCEALFDRFLLRKSVSYVGPRSLERLVFDEFSEVSKCLTLDELDEAVKQASKIEWSESGKVAFLKIVDMLKREGIRPSDRRLRKSTKVAKAVAWLTGAKQIQPEHLEVLQYALWDDPAEHPEKVAEIVISVANPSAREVRGLMVEFHEIAGSINPRSAESAEEIAKLKEVMNKLKGLGPAAHDAYSEAKPIADGIVAEFMDS